MKDLAVNKKLKVVKMFLGGFSYHEIAQQAGVAKGSVVNIIDEFRDGKIPWPPGMSEYIDELRCLVVDLKKHSTNVAQVKSCLKLHSKLHDMGVPEEQADKWLDICQSIASPHVSNSQFTKAALELAKFTSEAGLGYQQLLDDYKSKLQQRDKLNAEIVKMSGDLEAIKTKYEGQKKQGNKELQSIQKAIAAAQDNFAAQKKQRQSQFEEYLAQNKLTWKKVKLANALLDKGLKKAGMNAEGEEEFYNRVMAAGSLAAGIKLLDKEQVALKAQVESLKQEKHSYTYSIDQLKIMNNSLFKAQAQKGQQVLELEEGIASRKKEAEECGKILLNMINDGQVTCLIIRFLLNPAKLGSAEFDQLVSLLVAIRQQRHGIVPKEVRDAEGNILCKCQVPPPFYGVAMSGEALDQARKELAMHLMPLVRDHSVTKFEYQLAELDAIRDRNEAVIRAIGSK